jgi:hypothetical protein
MNGRVRVAEQKREDKWHTRKWFKENYGVDPSKLGLPFDEAENPYYSKAAPMKLWRESDVSPHRDEDGIKRYAKRKEAGKKAFISRKTNLKEWFTAAKKDNPRTKEILKRLWEIGDRISELHDLKEECRECDPGYDSSDYWDLGIEHCEECERMTKEQCRLREEREELFSELETLCGRDKRTIQLARHYLREDPRDVDKDSSERLEASRDVSEDKGSL